MREGKIIVVLVLLVSVTKSAPLEDNSIIKYENEPNTGNGLYRFEYQTSNGSTRKEHSELKTDKDNNEYIIVIGEYEYRDPAGTLHYVTYTADENGFKQQDNIIRDTPSTLRLSPAALGSLVGGGLG